jgi:uncharacterized membrane protein
MMKRLVTLGFIMGMVYFTLEGFWRGWTNIAMLFIGGFCGVIIGLLNEYPQFVKLKVWQQSLIGVPIVLVVELISGLILNIWLGYGIWDYSEMPGNLYGQICISYSILWFLLVPFGVWMDDWLRWKLYGQGRPYGLKKIYRDLITLK